MQNRNCFLKGNPRIVCREEEDDALLFDPETGVIRILNQTGYEIWKLCDGALMLEQIIEKVKEEYPEIKANALEKDVIDFIDYMQSLALIDYE